MSYVVAIPSYKRAGICRDQTLKLLDKLKVDKSKIFVFVADEAEYVDYRVTLGDEYQIIVGVKGISAQRRFYLNYFAKDTRVVSLDDDIAELLQKQGDKLVPYIGTMDELSEQMFALCEAEGARLWGINPVMNAFFMNDYTTVGLRFICANFMGAYAQDWIHCDPERRMTSSGEDHHSTLRAFIKYGAVVRAEYLCPKTKYWAAGGIDAMVKETEGISRAERHSTELHWVESRYPELAKVKLKDGLAVSMRLKTITHRKIPNGTPN
jgi:hypothetical protein